jgi:small conductance mechanosensitive channel
MAEHIASILGMEELTGAFEIVYRIGMCIFIFIIGLFVIKLIQKAIKKSFAAGGRLNPAKSATMSTVCCSVAKYIVYFLMLCYLLSVWGVDPTSLLALGGLASVAVGLGAQSIIQDILTGAFILVEDQFSVGDVVKIEGYSGTVESVGMRTTRIRSADGDLYIIPNGQIKIITNMSKGFNRAVVDVGISYDENIDRVINLLTAELEKIYNNQLITGIIDCPQVLGVEQLADSSVIIRIRADCSVGENWNVERQLRRLIKNALDREGIEIPFPQQVVHISDK